MLTELIELEVRLGEAVRRDSPQILEAARQGLTDHHQLGNYNYLQAAFLLGHLHVLEHPANPLRGAAWCADLAMEMTDAVVADWQRARARGEKATTAEWSPLITVDLLAWFGPQLEPARRARWMEFVEAYLAYACERPFGFTSPNHEVWRQLLLYRAGQVLGRPALRELAVFFCRQELTYQAAEGFWEEGRHHGPSMKYNQIMLAPLAWLYRLTGDEAIGVAARRLATFMATYTFPDGTTVGAFDGRQSTSLAFFSPVCPGLELVPTGRTLNARGLQLYRETGMSRDVRFFENSTWYAYFGLYFHAACCRYYAELVPGREEIPARDDGASLPIDRDTTLANRTAAFDGVLHRRGPWVLALSSQNSDIARNAASIYRLERQSRIELWHRDARLLLGGGHNRLDGPVPYANAVLDTGFAGETAFGRMEAATHAARRSYYMPRLATADVRDGVPELALIFGHGTVRYRFLFQDDRHLEIAATWDVRRVQRLGLQIPLIVWHNAALRLDGREVAPADPDPAPLTREIAVQGGPFHAGTRLTIPAGVACRVWRGLPILRCYLEPLPEPDRYLPMFSLALVCLQWTNPEERGSASFLLETGVER
jgi:hypothetical protein